MREGVREILSHILLTLFLTTTMIALFSVFACASINKQIDYAKIYYDENYIFSVNCYVDDAIMAKHNRASDKTVLPETYSLMVEKCLDKYPEQIRTVISTNWTFVFTLGIPELAAQQQVCCDFSNTQAAIFPFLRSIFVCTEKLSEAQSLLAHEIGHAVACEYGRVDLSSGFKELFNCVSASYDSSSLFTFSCNSPSEFFAEAIAFYVFEPERMAKEAHAVADYMEEVLKEEPYDNGVEQFVVWMRGVFRAR